MNQPFKGRLVWVDGGVRVIEPERVSKEEIGDRILREAQASQLLAQADDRYGRKVVRFVKDACVSKQEAADAIREVERLHFDLTRVVQASC